MNVYEVAFSEHRSSLVHATKFVIRTSMLEVLELAHGSKRRAIAISEAASHQLRFPVCYRGGSAIVREGARAAVYGTHYIQ